MEQSASESSDVESDAGPPLLIEETLNNNETDAGPPQLKPNVDYHNCAKCHQSNHTDKKEFFSAGGFKKTDNSSTEWIQCDACDKWYHVECVGLEEFETRHIASYHCASCESAAGPTTWKEVVNDHRYEYWNAEEKSLPAQVGTKKWIDDFKLIEHLIPNSDDLIIIEDGNKFMDTFSYDQEWKLPYKILNKDGLGLELPSPDFDMKKLVEMVGADEAVDTIDVYIQQASKMSMGTFHENWKKEQRERLYNMLSFEFSHTDLIEIIKAPKIMYELSWVHKFWPREAANRGDYIAIPDHDDLKPDVAMFCLLGMGGSYTDFHIDFGGSSVWYHVFRGEKVFYLIEPSEANFQHFINWTNGENKSEQFLNDLISSKPARRVVIKEGETILLPSGWIHAVYTPVDSIVFGGNFIHELNIATQLKVYDVEAECSYEDHFLFPSFELTNWYAALYAVERFNNSVYSPSASIIEGYRALLPYLERWFKKDNSKVLNFFRNVPKDLKNMLAEYDKDQKADAYDSSDEKKVKPLKFTVPRPAQNGKKAHHRDRSYDKAFAKAEKLSKEEKKSVKNIFKNGTQSGRTIKPSQWVQDKVGIGECQPGPSSTKKPFMQNFSAEERKNIENAAKADDGFARINGDSLFSSDSEDEIPKKKRKISVVKAKAPRTPKPAKAPKTQQQRIMNSMKNLKKLK